jgi:gamma-glutamyl:cysteine ligase YbdK (ATP-grasp superfamily)
MSKLGLFEAFGVELEYMIVDCDTLAVKPVADELLKHELGKYGSDFENGIVTWSNELALHVIEIKSTEPESNFSTLENGFADNVKRINQILEKHNAMLMPSAAHPSMKPENELKIWPHDNNEVYSVYNKIFDCRGHGWSNLQSTHLNLPFASDEEFAKLHAAIRLILPILPALCASSPILEGKLTGLLDTRLKYYKENQKQIPTISGRIIPEPIFSQKKYESTIYEQIKKDTAPFDPGTVLDPIWVNSRGAIARFDRGAIEIRVMDVQECPAADMAIQSLVIAALRSLVAEEFVTYDEQIEASTEILAGIFDDTMATGMKTEIFSSEYLSFFGLEEFTTAGAVWQHIFNTQAHLGTPPLSKWAPELEIIFNQGNLAERIVESLQGDFSEDSIKATYRKLSSCLDQNKLFII